jgi:hypothetical protein
LKQQSIFSVTDEGKPMAGKITYDSDSQADIRDAVWEGIVKATTDPETKRADIRNLDIIEILGELQALLLSDNELAKSSINLRSWADDFSKRLRDRTIKAKDQNEAKDLFRRVVRK